MEHDRTEAADHAAGCSFERPPRPSRRYAWAPTTSTVGGIRWLSAALILAVVAVINIEVLLRFFLDLPLAAVSDVSTMIFFWLSALGAAVALPCGAHMVVQPLKNRMGSVGGRILDAISTCSMLGLGAFLLVDGVWYAASVANEVLPVLGVSSAWEAVALPVSGALVMFFTIARVFSRAHEASNPNTMGEKPL